MESSQFNVMRFYRQEYGGAKKASNIYFCWCWCWSWVNNWQGRRVFSWNRYFSNSYFLSYGYMYYDDLNSIKWCLAECASFNPTCISLSSPALDVHNVQPIAIYLFLLVREEYIRRRCDFLLQMIDKVVRVFCSSAPYIVIYTLSENQKCNGQVLFWYRQDRRVERKDLLSAPIAMRIWRSINKAEECKYSTKNLNYS